MRFLISRIDNIGDIILSLPMAGLLKKYIPNSEVWYLARPYVDAVLKASPWVDGYVDWQECTTLSKKAAVEKIRSHQFDVFLAATANPKVSSLAFRAKIPLRIGTSRRYYHWYHCNKRVNFSRKNSDLHEMVLNLQLLRPFNIPIDLSKEQLISLLTLNVEDQPEITKLIKPDYFNIIIHPGSNGNGREWPISHFRELIELCSDEKIQIFFTGSKEEQEFFKPLTDECSSAINLMGQLRLNELMALIQDCDALIAGSTGPLHLAAALGIYTLGFFPPKKTTGGNRWGPIGQRAEYLTLQQSCEIKCINRQCPCVDALKPQQVIQRIRHWIAEKEKI